MPITNMDGSATVGATEFSFPNNSTTLTAQTDDAVMQALVDVNALAAGDQYQLRIYESVGSSGTQRVVYESVLTGAQSPPVFVFPSLVVTDGWDVTAKKLSGTDRTIKWSVRKIT